MDAVGLDRQGDVGAGVDEERSSQFSILIPQLGDEAHGFAGQRFQVAGREIFLAELDVVHAGEGGFRDFFEETATAGEFVSGKPGAVGDVVEQAAGRH